MAKTTAIVLAGGKTSPEMIAATGVENRALVELAAGRTMLSFVTDALKGASEIGDVYLVGDVPAPNGVILVSPGDSILDNMMRGLAAAKPLDGERALIVTSDIPFITPDAVDDFVQQTSRTTADFCYPIIPMETYERDFSGMKRTTLKLREGRFTGGNMVLVNPVSLLSNRETIMGAYAARKDVLALGRMLGWGLLARIVLSQVVSPNLLSIPVLELGVGRLLGEGATAKAIITQYASIGTDVDNPEDVEFARKRFGGMQI